MISGLLINGSLSPSTTSDLNLFLIALMAVQLPSRTFPHNVVVAKLLCPNFILRPGPRKPMKGEFCLSLIFFFFFCFWFISSLAVSTFHNCCRDIVWDNWTKLEKNKQNIMKEGQCQGSLCPAWPQRIHIKSECVLPSLFLVLQVWMWTTLSVSCPTDSAAKQADPLPRCKCEGNLLEARLK